MFSSESDLQRADHLRDLHKHDLRVGDPLTVDHVIALNRLVAHCEGLVASATLPPQTEAGLRDRIAATLAAFQMPSLAELQAARDE
jgi:hypothetical protein